MRKPRPIAEQQGFPQPLPVNRLGEIARRLHLIAPQGHFQVGGDEDDRRVIPVFTQGSGQGHAVQSVHHHVQQEDLKPPAMLDGGQQVCSAFVGGDPTGQSFLRHDLIDQVRDPLTLQRFVIADCDMQLWASCFLHHGTSRGSISISHYSINSSYRNR